MGGPLKFTNYQVKTYTSLFVDCDVGDLRADPILLVSLLVSWRLETRLIRGLLE